MRTAVKNSLGKGLLKQADYARLPLYVQVAFDLINEHHALDLSQIFCVGEVAKASDYRLDDAHQRREAAAELR